MKRIIMIFVCVLLMGALALPVSAAAYMGLSASSGTLSRSDSFTVYVNLSNDQEVGRGGIVLSYDSSVFEFVGGSCNVSGATLAEVSAGRNGGVFALAENRVVSGTIFTIQMRVRDDAPFGTYAISGSASMDVPCGAGSCTVTVACRHDYGNYSVVSDTSHKRACTICLEEETADHRWDSGKVSQQATCTDTGVKVFTCADCGHSREETIPVSSQHEYAKWDRVDEKSHTGTCDRCNQKTTTGHTWNSGTVTTPATCTTTGSRDLTCTGCGEEKTDQIPVTDHTYTAFTKDGDDTHSHSCTGCGKTETQSHSYSDAYGHDVNAHYLICDGCGHQKSPAPHTPGAPATDDTPQTCTTCGRVLKPAGNHVHSFASSWSMDPECHWYACDGCDEQSGLKLHVYTDDCDESCDVCGYARIPTHSFSSEQESDRTGHWYPCTGCDERKQYAPHTPGPEATISAAQTCTVCGYEIAPRVAHTHVYDTQLHYHQCQCGETTPAGDADTCELCAEDVGTQLARFPWWILCIAETLALLALIILPNIKEKKQ